MKRNAYYVMHGVTMIMLILKQKLSSLALILFIVLAVG